MVFKEVRVFGGDSEVAGVADADVTEVATSRLRRRSRWVCSLEDELGGPRGCVGGLFKRRWIPDLPVEQRATIANGLAALVRSGVRFHGGGTVPTQGCEGSEVFLHVELEDGTHHTVFPSLVAELSCFATFRKKDAATLLSLRYRALEWCKSAGLSWWRFQPGFASSVAIAMANSSQEHAALAILKNVAVASLDPLV